MHIRKLLSKLLSMACCIIVMIAVCLFVTMSCLWTIRLFRRGEVMTPQCLETQTYTTIIDTDGMEHSINQILIGPSGSSILKDADGHTVIFYKNKFYHGLDRTQCIKCYELSRLPNNN